MMTVMMLSLIFSLFAAEIVLRIKNSNMKNYDIEMWKYSQRLKKTSRDPLLDHEQIASSSALLESVVIRTNKWGLRGAELSDTTHKRRIIFLGSSITLGWGVKESDTLTERLQQAFAKDGQDVEVLNAGVCNYNAVRYVELFLTKLKDLHPTDIVIHGFVRDGEPLESERGNIFLRNSQLAVTLWIARNRLMQKYHESNVEAHYHQIYDKTSPGFLNMQAAFRKLADYAHQKNIRVYFAMTPDIHNLTNYKLGFVHNTMKAIAAENGFIFVDLSPVFLGLKPESIWAMPGDPHPNALGHQLMAEAIYPYLARLPSAG